MLKSVESVVKLGLFAALFVIVINLTSTVTDCDPQGIVKGICVVCLLG
jgi:hypothetical protein